MAGPGREAGVSFGVVSGAAAETDEDLMHEELSRYSLEPSGYSGRILGWSAEAGDAPCQTFAVYRDGVGRPGAFVTRARGRVDDPDDVLNGFLRILGRLIDLASLSGALAEAGRTSLTEGPPRRPPGPDGAALAEITYRSLNPTIDLQSDSQKPSFWNHLNTVRTVSPTVGVWILWFGASLKARSLILRLEPWIRMI